MAGENSAVGGCGVGGTCEATGCTFSDLTTTLGFGRSVLEGTNATSSDPEELAWKAVSGAFILGRWGARFGEEFVG